MLGGHDHDRVVERRRAARRGRCRCRVATNGRPCRRATRTAAATSVGRPGPAHRERAAFRDSGVTRVQRELERLGARAFRADRVREDRRAGRDAGHSRSARRRVRRSELRFDPASDVMPQPTEQAALAWRDDRHPPVSGSRSRLPGKEKRQWQIDVTFLASSWRCIFGQGCQGVLTEPAPELVQGCCSYGAYESDKKVKEQGREARQEARRRRVAVQADRTEEGRVGDASARTSGAPVCTTTRASSSTAPASTPVPAARCTCTR